MNRFRKIVELFLAVAMFRVSYRQMSAVLLLLAVMMPITVPIPVWAYSLDLPEPVVENDRGLFSTAEAGPFEGFLDPLKEMMMGAATSEDDKSKTDLKTVADAKSGSSNGSSSAKVNTSGDVTSETETIKGELPGNEQDDIDVTKPSQEELTVEEVESLPVSASRTVMAMNQLPENEQSSVYSPQNNLGTPPGQTEADSSNRAAALPITHRPGAANFNFSIPLASLSGRQIDAGVGLTYNSRTWNKSCAEYVGIECVQNRFTYDIEQSWIAPGFSSGFGYMETRAMVVHKHPNQSSNFQYFTEIVPAGITDPNGTRHELSCVESNPAFPGTYTTSCKTYRSGDGTFINVPARSWVANPGNGQTPNEAGYGIASFTVSYPNGTKITYGGGFGTGVIRRHYPLKIEDRNGNWVRIFYKDTTFGRIDKIVDTLNREIKFYYENDQSGNPDKLVAVTVPGMGADEEIQTVRFYYENLELDPSESFSNNAIVPAASTERVLKWIYLPGTKTAYKYFYHSKFGMMTKIERHLGVTASTNLTSSTGTILNEGVWAATTEYNFPDGLTRIDDVPRYNKRTDDWYGRQGPDPQETEYVAPDPEPGEDYTSTITVKDNGFDVETATKVDPSGMLNEISVTKISGSGSQLMSKNEYTWTGRNLKRLETTNDAGLIKATEFEYDSYNNPREIRECGYAAANTPCSAGSALRITSTTYETGAGWLTANLLGLVKSVETKVGGATVSKTLFEYDHAVNDTADDGTLTVYDDIDESGTHNTFYNPSKQQQTIEICPVVGTDGQDAQRSEENGCHFEVIPGHTAAAAYRGNVTKVGRLLTLTATTINSTDADVTDYNYDIAGNLVSATLSCCQLKTIEYGDDFDDTGYAFPTEEAQGGSTLQLENHYTYNRNTGLLRFAKDENDKDTEYQYESDTLRPKKTIFPNTGYVESFYSDKEQTGADLLVPYVRQKTTLESSKFVESYSYFDARGAGLRTATQTPDGWSVSAVENDLLGRATKTYNPFYASTPTGSIPAGTKFVEVTGVDALGRTTGVKLQDSTTVSTHYSLPNEVSGFNKTFVTVTDQAGKKRRRIFDAFGHLVRVDEPSSTGALPDLADPAVAQRTDYGYDGNDNLTSVIQSEIQQDQSVVTQERKFKYDPLSRLVAEKQVEAEPTLTETGEHGEPASNKWTKVLKYTGDGLLHQSVDARGVTSTFGYVDPVTSQPDPLNRVRTIQFNDGTPKSVYTYDQARTGHFNKGALTRVETVRETSTPAEIFATSTEFDYDLMGRLVRHRQWINGEQYDLGYSYNLAGQLTTQTYPSGKIVTNTYDSNGRLSSVADVQKTYLGGLLYQGKGNSLSQMTLGNGTTETFTLNDRLQLEVQELKKGSDALQRYGYSYGELDSQGVIQNNGKLESVVSHIGTALQSTQKFKYDHIGRLKESAEYRGDNGNLTYKQVFDFDRFGNLYRKGANNPTTGQANPLAYVAIEEAIGPGTGDIDKSKNQFRTGTNYDDAGNVTTDNKFRQMDFAYDANGRQIKATSSYAPDAWTVYDAAGNRVGTKVNNVWRYMVYDAMGKLVAEYGQKADGLGGVKYLQQDWQGSVRTATNNNGFVVTRTDHQAFGGDIGYGTGQRSIDNGYSSDPTTRQGYGLTERDDATGQDHAWFRKNENLAGRWTSPDPYNGSMDPVNPQSFNRYSYVQAQPTNFVDPSGLMEQVHFTMNVCSKEYGFCVEVIVHTMNIGGSTGESFDVGGTGETRVSSNATCGDQIILAAEKTDLGDMSRLIFQEATELSTFARTFPPTSAGYQNAVNNYLGEMEMIGSIPINSRNLTNSRPNLQAGFGNAGGSISDFIRSVGASGRQFAGFLADKIDNDITTRIKNALNGPVGRSDCRKLMDAILVASGLLSGTRNVRGGIYGMRTADSGSPGGNYTLLQSLAGSGNAFFGLQPSFLNSGKR